MNNVKERNPYIELLRAFSMLGIVFLHLLKHGGVVEKLEAFTAEYYFYLILYGIVYCSVDLFVLISGYFLVRSKFKVERIIRLYVEVFFYSLAISLIVMVITGNWNIVDLIKSALPIVFRRYWFASVYFCMYLLTPFINILLNNLSKAQYEKFLLLLGLLFVLVPIISLNSEPFNSGGGNGIVWFLVLYAFAGYIRLYPSRKIVHYAKLMVIPMLLSTGVSKILIDLMAAVLSSQGIAEKSFFFFQNYSVTVMLASLSLFVLVTNITGTRNAKISDYVIKLGKYIFAVYLIHDHEMIRNILWSKIMPSNFLTFPILFNVIIYFGVVLAIFLVCIQIEAIRVKLFSGMENTICSAITKYESKSIVSKSKGEK